MVGGVDARAPWPAGGLLVRGFGDDQMGDLVRGGAAVLGWSSSSTTTWKSICFESSLDSGLSASSSSSLLTFPYSLAWASTVGSSGKGTRSILLKGSSMALNISIQPSMNLNFRA